MRLFEVVMSAVVGARFSSGQVQVGCLNWGQGINFALPNKTAPTPPWWDTAVSRLLL